MEIQKTIKELFPASEIIFHEEIITFKKSFNFRNGFDSKKFTQKILERADSVPELSSKLIPIEDYDDENDWPKPSYFVSVFELR